MKTKVFLLSLALMLLSLTASAQNNKHKRFNPQQFEKDLQAYILNTVELSAEEKSRFLPIYEEMRSKQREYFRKERANRNVNLQDEKACEQAVRRHDENEVQLKRIQQEYHYKFLKIMPASKVYRIIKAEDAFHRKSLRKAVKNKKR